MKRRGKNSKLDQKLGSTIQKRIRREVNVRSILEIDTFETVISLLAFLFTLNKN